MDEGRAERERQPVISNLFPVSEQSVLSAFRDLIPPENPSADQVAFAAASVDEERRILLETNPHVLNSLEELIEPYTEDKARQMRLGNLICYRALREEAISRRGLLPILTEDFVKQYGIEQDEKLERELEDKSSLEPHQIGIQIRKANIAKFRNQEPEFSKIIEREFGIQSGWFPEDDLRYSGIIDLYLLFRKGCRGPKNFQQ